MPRKPTGRPTGRPVGSGRLGLGTHDEHTRLTVRIPNDLYTRLEAFAEGRSYVRGTPQLAGCVRALLEHALVCPYKRQTVSVHTPESDSESQPESDLEPSRYEIRQTEITQTMYDDTLRQTEITPPLRLDAADLDAIPVGESVAIAQQPAEPVPAVSPRGVAVWDKAAVLPQLDAWKAAGVSLQGMADRLNSSKVPTFSGKGQWAKGTIGKLLAHSTTHARE